MRKIKLYVLIFAVMIVMVGCRKQNSENAKEEQNLNNIVIIDLLDENSYERNGKQMAKAVERLIDASMEDFHEVRVVPGLFGGRYLEASDSPFATTYYSYIGEMKKDKPHGYGVLVGIGACYGGTENPIYYIGKFNEGTIEDNYGMSLGGDYDRQYIFYEGEMECFTGDNLNVCPADGNVELYHNLNNTQSAFRLSSDDVIQLGLGGFKVAKCMPEYIGKMKDGEYHGKGKIYSARGDLLEEGEFENGYLVNGNTYEATETFEEPYVEDSYEYQTEEEYTEDTAEIQEDDSYFEGLKIREGNEVIYFAGEYYNEYMTISISQWSERDFMDISAGEDCAAIDIYQGENYLDATLIKEGDNYFSIVSNDGALCYGMLYVTEEYIEVTDSGDMGLDGMYTLNYRYIS